MARFSRMKTLNTMIEIGVIPVFYTPEAETAKEIIKSLYEGGALCIEMTNRGDGAIDVFRELEKFCISNCPDVILGVGSVIDGPTAAMYISYGANFVVGPAFDKDTAIICNRSSRTIRANCWPPRFESGHWVKQQSRAYSGRQPEYMISESNSSL